MSYRSEFNFLFYRSSFDENSQKQKVRLEDAGSLDDYLEDHKHEKRIQFDFFCSRVGIQIPKVNLETGLVNVWIDQRKDGTFWVCVTHRSSPSESFDSESPSQDRLAETVWREYGNCIRRIYG